MKSIFLSLGLLLVCALSSCAYAKDCDLTIRDGNAAQDLSRVLHCFDERIRILEGDAPSHKEGSVNNDIARNPATFDAGTFLVSVRSVLKDRGEATCVNVGLSFKNRTTEKLFLALEYGGELQLIDEESGLVLGYNRLDGLKAARAGAQGEVDFSQILPNLSQGAIFRFCSNLFGPQKSGHFNLVLPLLVFRDQRAERSIIPLGVTLKGN